MLSVIPWIVGAYSSDERSSSRSMRVTLKAIIVIDALVICLAYVLYAASILGVLPRPILDLAKPFL